MEKFSLNSQQELNDKVAGLLNKFESEKYILFLSGGKSPLKFYEFLAKSYDYKFPGAIAQADERMAGITSHKKSNFMLHYKTGLIDRLTEEYGNSERYYPMNKERGLERDQDDYENVLDNLFSTYNNSVAVMGMGMDGHTAGILPNTDEVIFSENLVEGYESFDEFKIRMTITPKCIRTLSKVILLLIGQKKIDRFEEIWESGNHVTKFPVLVYKDIKDLDVLCLSLPT